MTFDEADLALLEIDPERLRAAAPALLEEVRRLRERVRQLHVSLLLATRESDGRSAV